MTAVFLKRGNTFTVSTRQAMDLHDTLPAANYVVKQNPLTKEYYLEQIESFQRPSKVYGNTAKNTDRILRTFNSRSVSTGVMLTGEKGSGKSLLAKMIALSAAEQDVPTLVINSPFCGDDFNAFMQTITQPCIVLFDEFEKIYDRGEQEQILTLLDGVFPTKKLFMITCNDKWRVDAHMRNRPGRIFYMLDFKGLEQDFIREYCDDNLEDKTQTDAVCRIASLYEQFNFDMLKAMVEDMNRYGETPQEVIEMLNAKPEQSGEGAYKVESVFTDGKTLDERSMSNIGTIEANPLANGFSVEYRKYSEDGDYEWTSVRFDNVDLVAVDPVRGTLEFRNEKGDKVVLTRQAKKEFNWKAF